MHSRALRPRKNGFVLAIVLGIILIAGLLAAHALAELGTSTLVASQRVLHQRAFEIAESGLVAAMEQLQSGGISIGTRVFRSTHNDTESATVQTRLVSSTALPSGFSAGRVMQFDYELRSTGHSARDTAVGVAQGVRQLQAAGR